MRFFQNANYDFLKYRKHWAVVSTILSLLGLAVVVLHRGLNVGIDFAGGTQVVVQFRQPPTADELRKSLAEAGLGDATIQGYGADNADQFMIRTRLRGNQEEGQEAGDHRRPRPHLQSRQPPRRRPQQGRRRGARRAAVRGRSAAAQGRRRSAPPAKPTTRWRRASSASGGRWAWSRDWQQVGGRQGDDPGDPADARAAHLPRQLRGALARGGGPDGGRRAAPARHPRGGAVDARHAGLHLDPLRAALRHRRGDRHHPRRAGHPRPLRADRLRVQPHHHRRLPHPGRLLGQRQRRGLRPRARDAAQVEAGAASRSCSTTASTRRCRAPSSPPARCSSPAWRCSSSAARCCAASRS